MLHLVRSRIELQPALLQRRVILQIKRLGLDPQVLPAPAVRVLRNAGSGEEPCDDAASALVARHAPQAELLLAHGVLACVELRLVVMAHACRTPRHMLVSSPHLGDLPRRRRRAWRPRAVSLLTWRAGRRGNTTTGGAGIRIALR